MKKRLFALILTVALLAGCKPTPEIPIVIGKTNDGWEEYEAEPTAVPARFDAPEHYENTLAFDGLTIEIDADVSVPDMPVYPVYILEPVVFTQDMADRILPVLLDGAELYEMSNVLTKSDVQERIDYYTKALNAEGNEALTASYQDILAGLFTELETAPEGVQNVPASRELKFKEVGNTLVSEYGKRVDLSDTSFRFEWTESGRNKAAADGNAAISGIVEQPSGRRMYLVLQNTKRASSVWFGRELEDGRGALIASPDYDEAEAKRRADALLEEMGLKCDFLYCNRVTAHGDSAADLYNLYYCTSVGDARRIQVEQARMGEEIAAVADHAPALLQEQIHVQLDGNGLYDFVWEAPVKLKGVDLQSASLLPWDTVIKTVETMLGVKSMWVDRGDAQDEQIVGRRLHIDSIMLSYMQVRKDASLDERYYIPVWDVCGGLYYEFSEDYRSYAQANGGALLDENNEWDPYAGNHYTPRTFLTINALDGSVVNRNLGY